MADIAVVGIGNPLRGDDGVGWAVIDKLADKLDNNITLLKMRGEISELVELFANYPTVYCVDACLMEAPAGIWQRIDTKTSPVPLDTPQTSTHGLSLSQAIALASALNQLPKKLIVYAINAKHYSPSSTLSASLQPAIDDVVKNILKEEDIQTCMKNT